MPSQTDIGDLSLLDFALTVGEKTKLSSCTLFAVIHILHGGTLDQTHARMTLWVEGRGGVVLAKDVQQWLLDLPQLLVPIICLPGGDDAPMLLERIETNLARKADSQ